MIYHKLNLKMTSLSYRDSALVFICYGYTRLTKENLVCHMKGWFLLYIIHSLLPLFYPDILCYIVFPVQVVFGDIDPTAGAATEQELAEKYGKDNVRFLQCDVTDGSKFEGKLATSGKYTGKLYLIETKLRQSLCNSPLKSVSPLEFS